METNKTLDALHSDIMCVHNTIYEGGDFFHSHDGYELFLMLNGDMNFFIEQTVSILAIAVWFASSLMPSTAEK